jgi:hypothetical protein
VRSFRGTTLQAMDASFTSSRPDQSAHVLLVHVAYIQAVCTDSAGAHFAPGRQPNLAELHPVASRLQESQRADPEPRSERHSAVAMQASKYVTSGD